MPTLDPGVYGKYEQRMDVDIKGINIVWSDVPPHEMTRILPVITGVRDALKSWYKVIFAHSEHPPTSGGGYIHLTVAFKKPPDQAAVLILKSIGSGLLAATSWGGP